MWRKKLKNLQQYNTKQKTVYLLNSRNPWAQLAAPLLRNTGLQDYTVS
jgi:hypothetical protein